MILGPTLPPPASYSTSCNEIENSPKNSPRHGDFCHIIGGDESSTPIYVHMSASAGLVIVYTTHWNRCDGKQPLHLIGQMHFYMPAFRRRASSFYPMLIPRRSKYQVSVA